MADLFENFNLSSNSFNVLLVVDLLLLKNFDGHLDSIHNARLAILSALAQSFFGARSDDNRYQIVLLDRSIRLTFSPVKM